MSEENTELTAALAADRERVVELCMLLPCPDGRTRSRLLNALRSGMSAAEFKAKFGGEAR